MRSGEYIATIEFGLDQVERDMIAKAFRAGITEGRRRHQGYLSRLIQKGQWAETGLPTPKSDERLPGYHYLLNYLCDKLRVCGAVSFWQAVDNIHVRLEGR